MKFWEDKHKLILLIFFLAYIGYFLLTSFLRQNNFHTGKFDLGNMDQTVWNTIHGRIFEMSVENGIIISRLAFHADVILVLISPLYLIWEDPKMLLLLQVLIVAAGSFFVYAIALEIIKNKNYALLLSFAYLLNPAVERANLYDFHPVVLAATFLLATFYFYIKKNYKLFIFFAVLSALCKEEIWAAVSLFGLLLFFQQKKRLLGGLFFFTSISIFYLLIWHIIQAVSGAQHFAISYYSDLGDSPSNIVISILSSPDKVLDILTQPDRINYLVKLFYPLGFLSLFSPLYLIFAIPDLFINLLSQRSLFREFYYHYTATISPFIFISAIYSIAILKRKIAPNIINAYILLFSLFAAYLYGPLPGARGQDIAMYTKIVKNQSFINKYLVAIPKNYSVAVTNNLGAHVSQRQKVYVLPHGIGEADFIIFLRIRGVVEKPLLLKVENDPNYSLILKKEEFLVFKKIN